MKENVYTVSQVNKYIGNMFAQDFMMNRIAIKGEVSNCKYHPTGHIYFTLKDTSGALQAVMFAGNRRGLSFPMKNGDNVVALGSIAVYEKEGKYQLYAREIFSAGAGFLHQQFEELKKQLEEMGMFSKEYKQEIPKYVKKVGIVTASTGAAIRDIQNIAYRRNPYVQLILYPALVQGEGAAESIVTGIQKLDQVGVDVIIVGRGGGSIEDLWAFNMEKVAYAIFHCRTPIISAVGHETDVTISDFVADLRAPTPSAAAELAVYDLRKLSEQMFSMKNTLYKFMTDHVSFRRTEIVQKQEKLNLLSPENRVNADRQYCVELEKRLMELMKQKFIEVRHRMELCAGNLEGLSPLKKLSQGYAVVTDSDSHTITDVHRLSVGEEIKIHVATGQISAKVTEIYLGQNHKK